MTVNLEVTSLSNDNGEYCFMCKRSLITYVSIKQSRNIHILIMFCNESVFVSLHHVERLPSLSVTNHIHHFRDKQIFSIIYLSVKNIKHCSVIQQLRKKDITLLKKEVNKW